MNNEFTKVMSERTDEELVKIVTLERESYRPTAIEAAENEIKNRKIDISKFSDLIQQVKVEKEQKEKIDSEIVNSGTRFINFIIDLFCWGVLAMVVGFIIGFILPLNFNNGLLSVLAWLILLTSFIGYYAFMEIKFQKTVGKFLTKTKVVTVTGNQPSPVEILTRTLCRFIPFDRLSFLFVKNGIHDYLSKTKVVKDFS